MTLYENNIGRVGPPVQGINIKLENWEEWKYRVTDNPSMFNYDNGDKPRPRGEVLIGGRNITDGYYKQKEKIVEEFFVDSDGVCLFRSGDIGEVE